MIIIGKLIKVAVWMLSMPFCVGFDWAGRSAAEIMPPTFPSK